MLRVEREPRSGPCTLGRPRTRGAVRFAGPSSPDAACAVPASLPTPARWQPRGAPHSARGPRGTSPTPGSVRSPRPARGVCFSLPGVRAAVCPEVGSRGVSRRTPVSQAVARSVSSRGITAGLPSGAEPHCGQSRRLPAWALPTRTRSPSAVCAFQHVQHHPWLLPTGCR